VAHLEARAVRQFKLRKERVPKSKWLLGEQGVKGH
jgi:hypothetical protein